MGVLLDGNGSQVAWDDDGQLGLPDERFNFHLRWAVPAGVYFIAVLGYDDTVGEYELNARAATDPGGVTLSSASPLSAGTVIAGAIGSPHQPDYFVFTLSESKNLAIDALGVLMLERFPFRRALPFLPVDLKVYDSGGNRIRVSEFGNGIGVRIRDDFSPGTYFIKVEVPDEGPYFPLVNGTYPAPYLFHFYENETYTNWFEDCEDATESLVTASVEDPLYGCQWHLKNFEPGGHDIDVEGAWEQGHEGEGINVVVVDTSIDYEHEDLIENFDRGCCHDFGGQGGAFRRFEHHGTNVAGVIAARNNQVGVRGVAPRATIFGHNMLTLDTIEDRHLAEAMSRRRADTAVSNNSWGPADGPGIGEFAPVFWEAAVEAGVKKGFGGKGTFYAFAAGNGADDGDDANLDEFANFHAVTAVCAVGDEDVRVVYSEIGANLWVCAPSLDLPPDESRGIVTTENSNTYYRYFNGTSASTPIVSGVAALMREANSELTWRDLKLILAASARKNDPGHAGWEDVSIKYDSSTSDSRYHYNYEYGFGMVDAGAAVELSKEWTNLPPQLTSEVTSSLNQGTYIPDAYGSGPGELVSDSLRLNTPIQFTEYVELNVDFEHESFRDLEFELVSPSGRVSRILAPLDTRALDVPSYFPLNGQVRFGSAKHLGENPNGVWTLRVRDYFGNKDGMIRSWNLKVYGHGAGCWQRITIEQVETGYWDASHCSSLVRPGSASRYYTFNLPERSEIRIRLESEVDPYLYLWRGEARDGRHLHENDDHEGDRTVSLIEEPLGAGTYTIEATTYGAGESGSFRLSISGAGGEDGVTPGTDLETDAGDGCVQTVSSDGIFDGQWMQGCESRERRGSYSNYYSFTLAQESQVRIRLESTTDPYLSLRRGVSRSGVAIAFNDDVEPGVDTNSQLDVRLATGTYTIEATTYHADSAGSFRLTISGFSGESGTSPWTDPETGVGMEYLCGDTITSDGAISGKWTSGCQSQVIGRGFARYSTFSLNQQSQVTIDLESTLDPYLYLRRGTARSNGFLHENDDVEPRVDTDSRIVATLAAGAYTIEATTYYAGQTGNFTLRVSGLSATTPQPTPGPAISVSPTSGPPGTVASLGGEAFKAFVPVQRVTVGSIDVTPAPRPGTDRNGQFAFDIIIPGLDVAIQTIEVQVGDTTASTGFTVTDVPVSAGACVQTLTGDQAVADRWASGCESQVRDGSHARYYGFTLEQGSQVTIGLDSSLDPYLYLRSGDVRTGDFLYENDDVEQGNLNSRINASLSAGTYTIEATTYYPGEVGSFTLRVNGLGPSGGAQEPPQVFLGTASVNGMPVNAGASITAWDGERQIGSAEAGEGGRYVLLTFRSLGPITFKIGNLYADQTHPNWVPGEITAGFDLTVTDPCGDAITADGATSGTWASDCQSQVSDRGYARYYTFTLAHGSEVIIDLESSVDTYLYLRRGEYRSGAFLHESDDVESGVNTNSLIEETLAAGTYTIEATTYYAGETGSFTLTISGLGGGSDGG